MITHTPTTPRLERRVIKVARPGTLDDSTYRDLLGKGWQLASVGTQGDEVCFEFVRAGRPRPGDVERRG